MRLFVAVVPPRPVLSELSELSTAVSSLPSAGETQGPGSAGSAGWSGSAGSAGSALDGKAGSAGSAGAAGSAGSALDGNYRWSTREQWHVTLAFLGSVADSVLPSLRERLARAAGRHGALSLSLAGGGAFPSSGRARVLWTGVDGDVQALRKLAWSVAAAARRAGVDVKEDKRFRPHVTLARLKEPGDAGPAVAALEPFASEAWRVTSIQLIESRLAQGPGGRAQYEMVESYDLASPKS